MKMIFTGLMFATLSVGAAFSADLTNDARITRELTAAAIADEIRNNCGSISANMVVGLQKMYALKSHAKNLGASDGDIKAFLDSDTQRSRIKMLRNKYLDDNGVVQGDAATFCALGAREKAQGTLIGSLLK